jgi:siroheme synthase-like protein
MIQRASYPIHLDLSGRRALVVGAGRVATRKIERLVDACTDVRVVAPRASAPIRRLAQEERVRWLARVAREDDVDGCFLVIAATDDAQINAQVGTWARAAGALISRVDAPAASDFTVPACVRSPHLEATISTYGEAPSASRRLGRELRAWTLAGPDRFVEEVAAVRRKLQGREDASARLRALGEGRLYEACARGDEATIHATIQAALEQT